MRMFKVFSLLVSLVFISSAAQADVLPKDGTPVHFGKAYAYQTAPKQMNGAAFFKVQNLTKKDIKIVKAASEVAKMVELHTHVMEEDNMSMYPVEFFTLPAKETHELKPTGDHIMLMMLNAPLEPGNTFDVELTLDTGDVFTVPVEVRSLVD